jgi:hypothetical protein
MAVTPLIKPIQTKKGIFYTFQSALEDLNLTFNNNGANKFRFSKFVLLRIPEIGDPNTQKLLDNKIQFDAIGETPLVEGVSIDQNINLAKSFQNYALNLEALLISSPLYNRESKLNVSERVFWKWLKEHGAIRWRTARQTSQLGQPEVSANVPAGESRFAEDFYDYSASPYSRVAVYVGDIDVVNSVKNPENSYSELYIHVPTTVGSTPTVLFKSTIDSNYGPGMLVINNPDDPLNEEYLKGRNYYDQHPVAGMDLLAYYDLDANALSQFASSLVEMNNILPNDPLTAPLSFSPTAPSFWWGSIATTNTYFTEPSANYNRAYVQRIKKVFNSSSVEYLRSTLDGVTIDFNLDNYAIAYNNPQIKTFSQLNDYVDNRNFEFNAILVYYDVYDDSGETLESEANLYGVYFLNKVERSGLEYAIPFIEKDKPDIIAKTNGNSFAFKINVKFDTSIEDTAVEKSINDFNTFSLDLFTDVMTEFRRLQTKFNDKLLDLENLRVDVDTAKNTLISSNTLQKMDLRLKAVENSLASSQTAFQNANELLDMIETTSEKVDDLLAGRSSINVSYNLNVLRNGSGIIIDRQIPNEITIASDVTPYSSIELINLSPATTPLATKVLDLGVYNTYYRHSNNGASTTLVENITVKINDTVIDWRKGQRFDLVIDDQIEMAGFTITIKTDAKNKLGNPTAYGKTIAILTASDFPTTFGRNGRPIITIICKDDRTLDFVVDKIIR